MFLNSINHFRAIAIVLIVAYHAHGIADFTHETLLGMTFHNMLAGGTHFFVFISGFLFHHVFYRRYQWRTFLAAKAKYLLLPYTLLSLLPFAYLVVSRDWAGEGMEFFSPTGPGFLGTYIIPYFKYYLTGYRIQGYWYIPFAMLLFAMSPLYMKFARLNLRRQLLIVLPLLVVSLFLHRPMWGTPLASIHSLVYFSPVFCLGILGSKYRRHLYIILKGWEWLLLVVVIALAFGQALMGDMGSYGKPAFQYGGIDLMLLQKVLFCFLLLVWLRRYEHSHWPIAGKIAAYSFGIYFIHALFMSVLVLIKEQYGLQFSPAQSLLFYPLGVAFITAFSMGVAYMVKRVFPRHSRYLVGS